MRIMFAGGGTGGHIYPALAIAEEIVKRQPDVKILFIAGSREIELKIVRDAGFQIKTIQVSGLPRKVTLALLPFAWKLVGSVVRSRQFIRDFRPSVVMATGGYIAGPPIIAAYIMGIPVAIQEQNSFPGITNRKLGRFADIVFLGFHDAKKYFGHTVETMVTGNPVRNEIGTGFRDMSSAKFGLDPALKTVLVFGGSQGSHAINTAFSAIAGSLARDGIQLLWQTGEKEFGLYKKFHGQFNEKVKVLPYIDDMMSAYASADLVVSRAGAITIAEITACGLPAIYIPLPTATANHQEHNARSLVNAGAAIMILEKDLKPADLECTIREIILSEERLRTMSKASSKLCRKDAAHVIANVLIERYGIN